MLEPGSRLGPYEVVGLLGAGGMGEVYRACDTRLDRTVAIKVLSADRMREPTMRQRLVREAQAIAMLSHRHICHLNELGHENGIDFLVMEYLDGETLATRLARVGGAGLPTADVLRTGIEIAEALSEAHGRGIVHRDLKPGNVMLTKDGVKLLDFGLAKLQVPADMVSVSTLAPTRQNPLTDEGSILGTWPYMAPEQVDGRGADARTDIFALGAVLYEMATGARAFSAVSHASLIAAILEGEPPPMLERRDELPSTLERVVRKCLAKSPASRWQSARDLADALKWIDSDRQAGSHVLPSATARRSRNPGFWLVATALMAAFGLGAAISWIRASRLEVPSAMVRRFVIQPPADAAAASPHFALSPDGRMLVYDSPPGFRRRSFDQSVPQFISGTEEGFYPTFSPDGQWLAFQQGNTIKKVPTAGGTAVTVADFGGEPGALEIIDMSMTWFPDDSIVFGKPQSGLFRLPASGGSPIALTVPDPEHGEIDHHSPRPIPGGRALLFGRHRGPETFDVALLDLGTGHTRVLMPDAFDARYIPTGHLLFARGESLLAAPFDAQRLALSGPPVVMVERILTNLDNGVARYAIADDGLLAYIPPVQREGRHLAWLSERGAIERLPISSRAMHRPTLSPDGKRIALQVNEGAKRDIWIYDIGSGVTSRLTTDGASENPIWTPDGQRLTFSTTKEARREIYWRRADGTQPAERLVTDTYSVFPGDWSPDGRILVFTRVPPTDRNDIGFFDRDTGKVTMTIAGDAPEQHPRFSPDGRWLAYSSAETGTVEVFVASLDGKTKRQISEGGGSSPVWRPDGRVLYYRKLNRTLLARDVSAFPATLGQAAIVIEDGMLGLGYGYGHPGFDAAADGRLLTVMAATEEISAFRYEIVLNWTEELKQRVPTR